MVHINVQGVRALAFNQFQYTNDYNREHYDTIRALVPKGKKDVVKAIAAERGLTVSQVIVRALEQTYKVDLS